jgi:hypothetical protein
MADGTFAAPDIVGEADDAGQTVLTEGGQIASRGTGDIPPLPSGAAPVHVGQWPPANWGPKLYQIDAAGNRAASARPGE